MALDADSVIFTDSSPEVQLLLPMMPPNTQRSLSLKGIELSVMGYMSYHTLSDHKTLIEGQHGIERRTPEQCNQSKNSSSESRSLTHLLPIPSST